MYLNCKKITSDREVKTPARLQKPVSYSHTLLDTPHSVGLIWTRDQPEAKTSLKKQHSQETNVLRPEGFEPAIPASQRPQTHALDSATTKNMQHKYIHICVPVCDVVVLIIAFLRNPAVSFSIHC